MLANGPTTGAAIAVLLIAGAAVALCLEARSQEPSGDLPSDDLRAGRPGCREGDFGCGHKANHDAYKSWTSPYDGGSCCNEAECRPTRAQQLEDGSWEAWVEGAWRKVPRRAMMEPDKLKDGRSHVCSPQ